MKGIILAGEFGTKLHPLTLGVPKQLLPVYDKPMVFYAIDTLVKSGVKDILVITTTQSRESFVKAIGDGQRFGVHVAYASQNQPEGIAQAVIIGKKFIGDDSVCLITGDTIIVGDSLYKQLEKAYKAADKSGNATIFVAFDYDPDQYGKVILGGNRKVVDVVGASNAPYYYSITGLSVYPNSVLKHILAVEKSERDLLEITSVHKIYHDKNKLLVQKLPADCKWLDTNSFDSILESSNYIHKLSIHGSNK